VSIAENMFLLNPEYMKCFICQQRIHN